MARAPDDGSQSGSTRVRPRVAAGAAARDSAFRLIVMEGPEKGQTFTVDGSQATRALIGQGAACEIRLTDPEVSRRHAALESAGAELRVTDLGSTNGTFVDRVRVSEAYLRGGEFLRVGATMFRVDAAEGAQSRALPDATGFGRLAGASPQMRRLYPLCERLARADVPVIIEGETGTGKEVLAESLHEEGPRGDKPFVVFDCTAVAPNLIESELFGHERGAFTGATATRAGVFEQAQGGTLFIDEIGDLDPLLQPKLLRAIERAEIRRVGGDRWIKVDVRLLSATRRDLDREVQAGRFREDLFHRLAVARIELPPLRHRAGDVPLLAHHFWNTLGGAETPLPEELLARWEDYPWPGNVRELRNAVARHLALGELAAEQGRGPGDGSVPPAAGDFLDQVVASAIPFPEAREKVIEELEQRYVQAVLARHGGDVAAAAAAAGIGPRYLQKLRARHR